MKLIANNRVLDCSDTQIMGILNVTPDSFFDGGKYNVVSKSIDHVHNMIAHGATIIDIGGESTRPGSVQISESEELDRVIPVMSELIRRFDVFISVNTSSALVMHECAMIGAHLINDVRSLCSDECLKVAVNSNMMICLVHMQGTPDIMQKFPVYSDVVCEVNSFFDKQITRCEAAGIDKMKLLLDPGFGFGKNIIHNYQLLSKLEYFHHFSLPLLIGVSRKSMIYSNRDSPKNKLIGSVACAVIAAMKGVHIIRVHDVCETMEALQTVRMIQRLKIKENT